MRRGILNVLPNLLTALSLVLCVAACGLWVRSYMGPLRTNGGRAPGVIWQVQSDGGGLTVSHARVYHNRPPSHIVRPGPRSQLHPLPGLRIDHAEGRMRARVPGEEQPYRLDLPTTKYATFTRVETHYGLPCLLSAVLPALWLRRVAYRRGRARVAAGLCPSCGYDLRATPARCPECGTAAASITPVA